MAGPFGRPPVQHSPHCSFLDNLFLFFITCLALGHLSPGPSLGRGTVPFSASLPCSFPLGVLFLSEFYTLTQGSIPTLLALKTLPSAFPSAPINANPPPEHFPLNPVVDKCLLISPTVVPYSCLDGEVVFLTPPPQPHPPIPHMTYIFLLKPFDRLRHRQ